MSQNAQLGQILVKSHLKRFKTVFKANFEKFLKNPNFSHFWDYIAKFRPKWADFYNIFQNSCEIDSKCISRLDFNSKSRKPFKICNPNGESMR